MTKVSSEDQANAIVSAEERECALKQERLEERERVALEELERLGFRVTLHEMPSYVESDILTRTEGGWKQSNCYAVMYAVDGRRKHVAGCSAVQALTAAQAWQRWQNGLKDDAPNKFVPSLEYRPEAFVRQQAAGDTAEVAQRRARGERTIVSFQNGVAEVVDAHGTPMGDTDSRASQYTNDFQSPLHHPLLSLPLSQVRLLAAERLIRISNSPAPVLRNESESGAATSCWRAVL